MCRYVMRNFKPPREGEADYSAYLGRFFRSLASLTCCCWLGLALMLPETISGYYIYISKHMMYTLCICWCYCRTLVTCNYSVGTLDFCYAKFSAKVMEDSRDTCKDVWTQSGNPDLDPEASEHLAFSWPFWVWYGWWFRNPVPVEIYKSM